jgi:hypothetical protein
MVEGFEGVVLWCLIGRRLLDVNGVILYKVASLTYERLDMTCVTANETKSDLAE